MQVLVLEFLHSLIQTQVKKRPYEKFAGVMITELNREYVRNTPKHSKTVDFKTVCGHICKAYIKRILFHQQLKYCRLLT